MTRSTTKNVNVVDVIPHKRKSQRGETRANNGLCSESRLLAGSTTLLPMRIGLERWSKYNRFITTTTKTETEETRAFICVVVVKISGRKHENRKNLFDDAPQKGPNKKSTLAETHTARPGGYY